MKSGFSKRTHVAILTIILFGVRLLWLGGSAASGLIDEAYAEGFGASGEGYNGEFGADNFINNPVWQIGRDGRLAAIRQRIEGEK